MCREPLLVLAGQLENAGLGAHTGFRWGWVAHGQGMLVGFSRAVGEYRDFVYLLALAR